MSEIDSGDYTSSYYEKGEDGRGIFGFRKLDDRRYWAAWDKIGSGSTSYFRAVMDDFGNLVETRE